MFLTNFDNTFSSDFFFFNISFGFYTCFSAEVRQFLISVRELKYCFIERGKAKMAWWKDELQLIYSKSERQSQIKEL